MTVMEEKLYCPPSLLLIEMTARYPLLAMSNSGGDIEDYDYEDLGTV